MEPSSHNSLHSSELPALPTEGDNYSAEQTTTRPEGSANLPPVDQPALASATQGLAQSGKQATQIPTGDANTTAVDPMAAGLMADDVDLIEKEWIFKAKAIVAQTKDDPYVQNKELSKVKAEYVKKRFNKDLKASKD